MFSVNPPFLTLFCGNSNSPTAWPVYTRGLFCHGSMNRIRIWYMLRVQFSYIFWSHTKLDVGHLAIIPSVSPATQNFVGKNSFNFLYSISQCKKWYWKIPQTKLQPTKKDALADAYDFLFACFRLHIFFPFAYFYFFVEHDSYMYFLFYEIEPLPPCVPPPSEIYLSPLALFSLTIRITSFPLLFLYGWSYVQSRRRDFDRIFIEKQSYCWRWNRVPLKASRLFMYPEH